jgi:acetoin utilization deacetylase AcuC-like enzyme
MDLQRKAKALHFLEPCPAPRRAVAAVHSEDMLRTLEAACAQGPAWIDLAPTFVTPTSFSDALLAVGATLACCEAVLGGQADNAFALVRPPGHHAEPQAAKGFCLLNNVAIAARAALDRGIGRVLIVDFDAHHGNGTQAAFLEESRAAYFSTQQEDIYPFHSGFMTDAPQSRGRIVNLPLPKRSGDRSFARITGEVLTPLVERFRPEMIFASAGFDGAWNDTQAELGLSPAGYHDFARQLVALAGQYCQGRLVCVLEGGYNPAALAGGIEAVLAALSGAAFSAGDPSPYPEPEIGLRIAEVRRLHGLG